MGTNHVQKTALLYDPPVLTSSLVGWYGNSA